MITLGLNAAFHDSAAALVVDGKVVAAAEEERFTRIKHAKRPVPFSAWELPFHAIDFCLERAGVTLRDVDHVAYSFQPRHFVADPALLDARTIEIPLNPQRPVHDVRWQNPWDPLFLSEVVNAPGQLLDGAPHHLRKRLASATGTPRFAWHWVDHHLAHQASAFLAAPFDRCAVLTLDGRGERATTTYGRYRDLGAAGHAYEAFGEVDMPHSLGILYERVTAHLGFLHSSDEYKVMALAALGKPVQYDALLAQVQVGAAGRYELADFDLGALFGPARKLGETLDQRHFDITASLQKVLETTVLRLAGWLREATGERRLAMAGGVALNCVMNSVLRDAGLYDEVWVQPAAGDAGTALGAALWTDARQRLGGGTAQRQADPEPGSAVPLAPRRWRMDDAYLGPEYTDAAIEQQLVWAKLDYRRIEGGPEALAEAAAELLEQNLILGWFQGRMEFGPRALGARSIIASPIDPAMQQRLNELKDREDFRPVAPAVPVERLGEWFTPADANRGIAAFMLFLYDVRPEQAGRIPSACHADLTARVQTVDAATNPRFHALLTAFGRRTGVPVLVNTSFNVRGEPVVCSPKAAIEAFFSTPLDALVIGSFILKKARRRGVTMRPEVSVVIPTYRRPELLARGVERLLAQTIEAARFEVLIVDDGHDDATRERVDALRRAAPPGLALRYLRPAAGRGPAVARNTGWRAAAAPLVAFTDDDTLPAADWLADGLAAMAAHPAWSALCGRIVVPLEPPLPRRPTDHELMTMGLESAEFVTANAFVRKAALTRVGGFDETFTRAWREDSDLQFRLMQAAGPVERIGAATVLHPARAERWGISLRQQKNAYFEALLYRKHPRLYRERIDPDGPPWSYYGIVLASVAFVGFVATGHGSAAALALVAAAALVVRFALRRLEKTSRSPAHVCEMLATSAAIPFFSVYWRLRGAWRFRVAFV